MNPFIHPRFCSHISLSLTCSEFSLPLAGHYLIGPRNSTWSLDSKWLFKFNVVDRNEMIVNEFVLNDRIGETDCWSFWSLASMNWSQIYNISKNWSCNEWAVLSHNLLTNSSLDTHDRSSHYILKLCNQFWTVSLNDQDSFCQWSVLFFLKFK